MTNVFNPATSRVRLTGASRTDAGVFWAKACRQGNSQ